MRTRGKYIVILLSNKQYKTKTNFVISLTTRLELKKYRFKVRKPIHCTISSYSKGNVFLMYNISTCAGLVFVKRTEINDDCATIKIVCPLTFERDAF